MRSLRDQEEVQKMCIKTRAGGRRAGKWGLYTGNLWLMRIGRFRRCFPWKTFRTIVYHRERR
jgi:hypothetical protein